MAIEFENPLTAGTVLVREAIQSQNYSPGSAGWIIEADGSAEFYELVVRGSGAGDTVIVGPSTGPQVQIGSTGLAGYIEFPTNRPIEDEVSRIVAGVVNSGLANESATLQVQGPSVTGADDRMIVRINSQANDASSEASVFLTHDDGAGTLSTILQATLASFFLNGPRLIVTPSASASSAAFVNTAAGHTGNLLRLQANSTDQLVVDNTGVATTYGANTPATWTPTISGGGTATLSTADGWYQRLGKMIYVYAYFVIGAAGSGATVVQLNLPFTPWRGTANRRQNLPGAVRDGGYANPGPVAGIVFAGGAGATVNRLVDAAGTDVTGAALTAGSIWVFEGWLREA